MTTNKPKSQTFVAISCLLIGGLFGFALAPEPPVNITGNLKDVNHGLLGLENKRQLTMQFNGHPVINGYLDNQNNGNLVGSFNNKTVNAQCSGTKTVTCLITYNDKTTQLTFSE